MLALPPRFPSVDTILRTHCPNCTANRRETSMSTQDTTLVDAYSWWITRHRWIKLMEHTDDSSMRWYSAVVAPSRPPEARICSILSEMVVYLWISMDLVLSGDRNSRFNPAIVSEFFYFRSVLVETSKIIFKQRYRKKFIDNEKYDWVQNYPFPVIFFITIYICLYLKFKLIYVYC